MRNNHTVLGSFTIDSGFIQRVNTLEFRVRNDFAEGLDPTGLLVTGLSGTARLGSAPSVPALGAVAIALLAALVGAAGYRRLYA